MTVSTLGGPAPFYFGGTPKAPTAQPEVRLLLITAIRTDGQTQHRIAPDPAVVAEYAELMREGVVFPPISVWWDGSHFWLSDGFQRTAAAVSIGMTEIRAEVWAGMLEEAQWHSYAANAIHGARLSLAERQRIVSLAMKHPNCSTMSDVQLAEYLHLPRTTLRRWRKELSWPNCQDGVGVRIVTRADTTYPLTTSRIGKQAAPERQKKAHRDLQAEFAEMKASSSPTARRLLTIFEHWVWNKSSPVECLDAIERVVGERHPKAGKA